MKTKLFTLLLAVAASIGTMFAVTIDGLNYNLNDELQTAEVAKNDGASGEIIIPSSVTYNSKTYSVTSIGEYAFFECNGLTSVTIPNSVTSIGREAFYYCSGLTSITIPNSVTSIGGDAFYNCSGLTSVTIPNSVTSIGSHAFYRCHGLTSVTIPNSVTSIGNEVFAACSSLTSIIVESGNTVYDSRNNCNAIIETATNTLIAGCQSTIIPNSVTSIGESAFDDCSGLTSVTIPNSVTSIGEGAFVGCTSLTSIEIPNSVTRIGGSAFYDCSGLSSVTIPNSVTSIGEQAFYNCRSLTSPIYNAHVFAFMPTSYSGAYTIPDGIESIAGGAFDECTGLTSVTIPNSVTSIGNYAFYNCSGLTSVTIGNSVTSIGRRAFQNCSGLTGELIIPNSVTSIGEQAFKNCSGLTSVTIGNSVASIGYEAFYSCTGLNSVTIEAEAPSELKQEDYGLSGSGKNAFMDTNNCPIYVPCGTLDAYKTAWSKYASRIKYASLSYTIATHAENGNVDIASLGNYTTCDEQPYFYTLTATPDSGYYFIQWSDGVTDNPRTIELTQDTILTALFDSIPAGQDTTATEIKNDSVAVSATPTEDNSVILEWPAVEGADTYTIAIYKNNELICTLVFDAEGHLISIRFAAPARDGNGRNIPVAEQAANGWRYVVNGLEGNATYTYSVVAKDENGNVLLSESIDFTMPGTTAIDQIDSSSLQGGDRGRLIFRNGQILILRGDKTYTLTGVEVK